MRLWTIQPISVWEQMQADGVVRVDLFRVHPSGWINPQYSWLAWQLRHRISGSRGWLPWFAYCARPDLRTMRHFRPSGSHEILIEFEAPSGYVIDFPCWAWHEVFCGQYLAFTRLDVRQWEARVREMTGISFDLHDHPLPEPLQQELESSWSRLFSGNLPARSWKRGDKSTCREAVVEELRLDWVVRTNEFVGTSLIFADTIKANSSSPTSSGPGG